MAFFEFHVSRRARDAYQFEDSLFSSDGNVIFADFVAARVFAQKINAGRPPERTIRAGQINALGLIDELQHAVLRVYRERKNPRVMEEALEWLTARIGPEAVESTLRRFIDEFPPIAVYKNRLTVDEYLAGETGGLTRRQTALEEMLMVWLANLNPAFAPFRDLFDDGPLVKETAYPEIMTGLGGFFAEQPLFGPEDQNLIDLLRAPALAAPDSLAAQLDYIRGRWGPVLGSLIARVWRGLDFIREDEKAAFTGAGPARTPVFGPEAQASSLALFGPYPGGAGRRGPDPEPERYSPDLDWMPNLVLIAKNTYVWLDQLSKEYQRPITRLDQIPDEELDRLRHRGFTGLWLIGLWERSPASRRIKQMMGNPEAVASAYSLFDYRIAEDLGGEGALQDLKGRARRRGIRLASDMVPNHMGIDSRWVIEHPDWFIGLDRPPFPAYAFDGPDLSWDARVGIQIENRYYDRADAAVVFKRFDRWTGAVKYIYHGNDGTSYPWNDTAQLDFLKAEVREAVIRTILRVARDFPVIRFDAAMTLAKRHFQRLWFPEPGTGGAIPSRAEHGLTRDEVDAAMPVEFWRDVVDRVAAEAPDTLLLAEAFWLMEGYFVRTLGMHRVYNSAFMNMLRDEDNAKYRGVMKATLEFDPEVLKRYVNFMNNPDERTAIEQFGDGDKYFGVCAMLATLPGLPMVGHGQVEGFTEKYGMEYRRAYYDEHPKPWLVERHEREIVPLFHKRHLFSGVEQFLLYDFYRPDGRVDENVFAYSNGRGDERALVVYHNKYAETRGWIRTSAAFAVRTGQGEEKKMVRKDLVEGLRLRDDPELWFVFKDQTTGLEYLRNCQDLCREGFFVELSAYKYHVFMDFREVRDDGARRYARLADDLRGGGVPNIEEAARDVFLRPVLTPIRELINPGFFQWLLENRVLDPAVPLNPKPGDEIVEKSLRILRSIESLLGAEATDGSFEPIRMRRDFEAILQLPAIAGRFPRPRSAKYGTAIRYLLSCLRAPRQEESANSSPALPKSGAGPTAPMIEERLAWSSLFGWAGVRTLGLERIVEWRLDRLIAGTLREMGLGDSVAADAAGVIKALTAHQHWAKMDVPAKKRPSRLAGALLDDDKVRQVLQVNEYQGIVYFNKEAFEKLLWWLMAVAAVDLTADPAMPADEVPAAIVDAFAAIKALSEAEMRSEYQLEKLKAALID
ncbi:MAG: alpha-amylase family glycosyl hydrolase [Candidatus Aminicenantes bacterium]|nr:alpha-amylase family glycosyl hydrolase [Candidatus Aminicenantes bacterium]